MSEGKGSFNSSIGFLLAAIGSAVGLGNLWGFPYKMGNNGGFAFLLLYLILAAFVGCAIMIAEFVLGRSTGKAPIEAYREATKKYAFVGWFSVIAAFLIEGFYCVLGAYCLKYSVSNMVALFTHKGIYVAESQEYFNAFIANGWSVFVYTVIFFAITVLILIGGVSGGIEKFSKVAMPALFVMLIIVIIKALTLPGAFAGVEFMFKPNWEVFSGSGWVSVLATAGGQMFFSLSLGNAIMITYASYMQKKEKIVSNAIVVTISDTVIALMAGLAVMPAVFAMGMEPAGGPGLLFVTLQAVFNSMGSIGPLFGFLMYFLVFLAAMTSSISIMEPVVSTVIDRRIKKGKAYNRTKITLAVAAVEFLVGVPVIFDALGAGGLPQPLGFCWLDFYDLFSEGILMPLAGLCLSIIVGYVLDKDWMRNEITLEGNKFTGEKFFKFCLKVTAPLGMLLVLVGQIDGFFGLGIIG